MLAVLPPAGNSVVRVTRNTVRSATTAYPYLDTKTLILHSSTDTALRWGEFLKIIQSHSHKSAACEGGEVAENQAPLHRCCTDYFNTADNESCIT